MGMPLIKSAQLGDLPLLMYEFAAAGDMLPFHRHDEATEHIIIVSKGTVLVITENDRGGFDEVLAEAGMVLDTFAGFLHGVVGITAGSKTVHITKNLGAGDGKRKRAKVYRPND